MQASKNFTLFQVIGVGIEYCLEASNEVKNLVGASGIEPPTTTMSR